MSVNKQEYSPDIFFAPRTLAQAQSIILTAEDSTTEHRWATETPYFADLIGDHMPLGTMSRVLDFGCGVGRMSKELIQRHGCRCFGVDFSPAMRALAAGYVDQPHFLACAQEMMVDLPRMDAIVAVWVIQHIPKPTPVIERLIGSLKIGGRIFLANSYKQVFPTAEGRWFHDEEFSVLSLFRERMTEVAFGGSFDAERTTPSISDHGWWGVFEKR